VVLFDEGHPRYVPGRGVFLVRHMCVLVVCYFVNSWATDLMLAVRGEVCRGPACPISVEDRGSVC
jgi:hypothetical protein